MLPDHIGPICVLNSTCPLCARLPIRTSVVLCLVLRTPQHSILVVFFLKFVLDLFVVTRRFVEVPAALWLDTSFLRGSALVVSVQFSLRQ